MIACWSMADDVTISSNREPLSSSLVSHCMSAANVEESVAER